MGARTHHVLVFQPNEMLNLAGAHLKVKRHNKANVYSPDTLKGKIFKKSDPTPWRLHIFQHGNAGMSKFNNFNMNQVANIILKTGIHKQPKQIHDEIKTRPSIRLDVCSSGLEEDDSGSPVVATVTKLKDAINTKIKKSKSKKNKIILWGAKGVLIAPWNGIKGGRIVADQGKFNSDLCPKWNFATVSYHNTFGMNLPGQSVPIPNINQWVKDLKTEYNNLTGIQKTRTAPKITEIESILKNYKKKNIKYKIKNFLAFKKNMSDLKARAKVAWVMYKDAMELFHESILLDNSLFTEKTPDPDYETRKKIYLKYAEVVY